MTTARTGQTQPLAAILNQIATASTTAPTSASSEAPSRELTPERAAAALLEARKQKALAMTADDITLTTEQIAYIFQEAEFAEQARTGNPLARLTEQEKTAAVQVVRAFMACSLTADDVTLSAAEEADVLRKAQYALDMAANTHAYWQRVIAYKQRGAELLTVEQVRAKVLAEAVERVPRLARVGGYVLDEWNRPFFDLLTLYFAQHPDFEQHTDLLGRPCSLERGILLTGNVGSGKTTLLEIFAQANRPTPGYYNYATCRQVAAAWQQKGAVGLDKFITGSWLLDDLGTEDPEARHYGDRTNVMADLLSERYDRNRPAHTLHVTTNLIAEQIKERYDPRTVSRMRELFNFFSFPTNAPDRRR